MYKVQILPKEPEMPHRLHDQAPSLVDRTVFAAGIASLGLAGSAVQAPEAVAVQGQPAAKAEFQPAGTATCFGEKEPMKVSARFDKKTGNYTFNSFCEAEAGDRQLIQQLSLNAKTGELTTSYTVSADEAAKVAAIQPPRVWGRYYSKDKHRWFTFLRPISQDTSSSTEPATNPTPPTESATIQLTARQLKRVQSKNPIRFRVTNPYGNMLARIK